MSDQVEKRKVEWGKIRSCIESQFRESMKDERRKQKERERRQREKESSILHPHPNPWKL